MNKSIIKHGKMSRKILMNFNSVAVYCLSNSIGIRIYNIDQYNETVLAGDYDSLPEYCEMTEQYNNNTCDIELGFMYGKMFVPFNECMRTTSY